MGTRKRGSSHPSSSRYSSHQVREGGWAVALVGKNLRALLVAWAVAGLFVPPADPSELKAETVAGFDRYIRATEERMDSCNRRFLVVDRLPDALREQTYGQLRQGQLYIEQLHATEDGRSIEIPGGLVHHWVGVVFIPRVSLSQTVAVLQDYDNYKNVYNPDVRRSKLLERHDNEFKIELQFYQKSIVTVVINTTFEVQFGMCGPLRALSRSYSTRIAELENPGRPDEHELPVGNDHGYVWRLCSYSRAEEQDGGVYLQMESVGLSRRIPWMFAWLINPLTNSIPRDVLSHLLNGTRKAVRNASTPAGPGS
jgi:hypothetical protein